MEEEQKILKNQDNKIEESNVNEKEVKKDQEMEAKEASKKEESNNVEMKKGKGSKLRNVNGEIEKEEQKSRGTDASEKEESNKVAVKKNRIKLKRKSIIQFRRRITPTSQSTSMNESSVETSPDPQQPQKNDDAKGDKTKNNVVNAEIPKVDVVKDVPDFLKRNPYYQISSGSHRQYWDQQNYSNSSFKSPYRGRGRIRE